MTSSPTLSPTSVPRRSQTTRMRKYRKKLLVASGQHAFELDDVAEFIFRQVDGAATLRQIGERVATEYDIPVEQAMADAAEFLAELVAHDVLETNS